MKKIYLFSIALLAFVGGAVAQPNPPGCPAPAGPIWRVSVTDPFPFCFITFKVNLNVTPIDSHWYLSLVDAFGGTVPVYGTGGPGQPTASYFVNIDSASGIATFKYDCPGTAAAVTNILVERMENGVRFISCQFPVQGQIVTPVKLTSFNGRLANDVNVSLDWTSAVEVDSYKYEVERSADGKYFEKVGTLSAAGSSVSSIRYTFNDELPAAGAYFYRLKQLDFNGTFEYSKVVYINSKKGAGAITKVFPNPFQSTIQLVGATSADLTPNNVQVSNITGQRIPYKVIGNSIAIDPSAPAGLYLVKVKGQVFKLEKAPGRGGF